MSHDDALEALSACVKELEAEKARLSSELEASVARVSELDQGTTELQNQIREQKAAHG